MFSKCVKICTGMIKINFKILVPSGKKGGRRMGSGWKKDPEEALTEFWNVFLGKMYLKQECQDTEF